MGTGLERTIAALHENVLACREVADLALASAEQLEQLAHTLEREAWHARLQAASAGAQDVSGLTETERRLFETLTGSCGAWIRLMRVYCSNVEAAFAANPRLASVLPMDSPLQALAAFWSDADERFARIVQSPVNRAARSPAAEHEDFLPTAPAAVALGCGVAEAGH